NLKSRTRTKIALKNLAVIADRLNDFDREVVIEIEASAELTLDTQQSLDVRIGGFDFLIDVGLRNARLFSIEQREVYPLYDCEPLRVALAHRRTHRLFGDYFWQYSVILGARLLDTHGVEA